MSERGNNSSTSSTQGQRASQRPSPSSVMLINDENEIQEDVGNGANKFVGLNLKTVRRTSMENSCEVARTSTTK
ncbi:hypothetical protein YC2023_053717 [Brassica napus]